MRFRAAILFVSFVYGCFGQSGYIQSSGHLYLYNTERERQLVEEQVRQQRELESLSAHNFYWRDPTPEEVANMEQKWKADNPFLTSLSMPDFKKRKIRVDKNEELNRKLADVEERLRKFEAQAVTAPTKGSQTAPSRLNPADANSAALQAKRMAEYNKTFDASVAKAIELYDFAKDPKSEGGKRMMEIDQALKANGDPLYSDPRKPLIIAQMAARELRIAPKATAPKTK